MAVSALRLCRSLLSLSSPPADRRSGRRPTERSSSSAASPAQRTISDIMLCTRTDTARCSPVHVCPKDSQAIAFATKSSSCTSSHHGSSRSLPPDALKVKDRGGPLSARLRCESAAHSHFPVTLLSDSPRWFCLPPCGFPNKCQRPEKLKIKNDKIGRVIHLVQK